MTSNDIAQFIGASIFLRKLAYQVIFWTTLREWYIRRAQLKALAQLKPDFTYLDAGSGLGQHSYAIAKKYPLASIIGIEKDQNQVCACNMLAQTEGLIHLKFHQGDLSHFVTDDAFDFIFCGSVLEHIENDEQVLKQFWHASRPGAHVLLYVPMSEKRIFPLLRRKMEKMILTSGQKYLHEHVRYYSVPEMQRKLSCAGFRIEQMTITYGVFGRIAYDIVTTVQYSRMVKFIFVFYFFLLHPLVLILMWLDFIRHNRDGNGLLVLAQKN